MMKDKIITHARSLVGTPYHLNQKGTAHDCLTFFLTLAEASDIDLPDIPAHHGLINDINDVVNYCDRRFTRIQLEAIQPADLLVLKYSGSPHLAIDDWIEDLNCLGMIHCSSFYGKVIRHLITGKDRRKLHSAYRIVG